MKSSGFERDLRLLRERTEVVVLQGPAGERVAVTPLWQGKTMTSTVGEGAGYGWINEAFIRSGRVDPQANLQGGEDRMWIGPEGGQFAFYFEPGSAFEFPAWRCPELIDRQPFHVLELSERSIRMASQGVVRNYSGTEFDLRLEREVRLLGKIEIEQALGLELPEEVSAVGHASRNQLWNVGTRDWMRAGGLPCIWNLGMFRPTPRTMMVLPFRPGFDPQGRAAVTSDYFGSVDQTRLRTDEVRGLALFRGDGKYRSKLGVGIKRACPRLGSWTPEEGRLTIVEFNLPVEVEYGYCNNLWQVQQEPFAGDVVNVYNDGPNETGGCLGPFYELETLSPALGLRAGEHYEHRHSTLHLLGTRSSLDSVSEKVWGISLGELEQGLV